MALVCTKIEEQVQETVIREIDIVINKIDNFCEDLPWPLDWCCHAVTTLIKIIVTVIDIFIRWHRLNWSRYH